MNQKYEELPPIPPDRLRFVLQIHGPGAVENVLFSSTFMDIHQDEFKKATEEQVAPVRAAFLIQRETIMYAASGGPLNEEQGKKLEKLDEAEKNAWDYASRAALLHFLSRIVAAALMEARGKGAPV